MTVKFVLANGIILRSSNIMRANIMQERIIIDGGVFSSGCLPAFLFSDVWPSVSTISAGKSPQNPLFSLPSTFLHSEGRKKKSALDKRHADRIGVELTMPRGTGAAAKKKGEKRISSRENQLRGRHGRKLVSRAALLSLVRGERSLAWPKGLNWISLN